MQPELNKKRSVAAEDLITGTLLTVPRFLSACRLDNINLTALLRYLDASKLAHKLQGFARLFEGRVLVTKRSSAPDASSGISTATFLSKIAI
ncbi:ATP-dependent DNA helicase DDX11-like, partial [Hyalella azteca]|uniref:ATP-dependent DNA helicase DDX11-like n=1 Tax=Hyalella azteca TaxID=294128 RepID=A0A979FVV5_HYAAZ